MTTTSSTSQRSAERRVPEAREGMLKVTEVFHSLQGEARDAGRPTVFVRLTGCPLRCVYCDSEYAFYGGEWMHIDAIVEAVRGHGAKHVCVTGGEPLAQKRCHELLTRLCDEGFEVSLETSGAIDVSAVDERVSRVLDLKTPGSGEETRNRWENLSQLRARDQVKFVICSREDYEWARGVIARETFPEGCELLLSPSWGVVEARDLAEWVLEDRLPVRVQVQLHKLLWGDVPGK